jgi:hypothetical protein
MINSILTGAAAGIVMLAGLTLAAFVSFYLIKRKISSFVVKLLSSPDGKTPGPLMEISGIIAAQVGSEVAQHLKAVFMGLQSVDSKNERKLAAQAVISGNSLLSAIAEGFPAVRKKLEKNPMLAGLASMAVDRFAGGSKNPPGQGNGQIPLQQQ